MARTVNWLSWPNVAMSRDYGWRGGCSATAVTGGVVGSVGWLGFLPLAEISAKHTTEGKILVKVWPMQSKWRQLDVRKLLGGAS